MKAKINLLLVKFEYTRDTGTPQRHGEFTI